MPQKQTIHLRLSVDKTNILHSGYHLSLFPIFTFSILKNKSQISTKFKLKSSNLPIMNEFYLSSNTEYILTEFDSVQLRK